MNNKIRQQFPIFKKNIRDKNLIYLDNAATTQKPESVVKTLEDFYYNNNANINRGIYKLSERATKAYENSRKNIASFINAKHAHEVIFVRGTTEAINLVAESYGHTNIGENDEIIITTMEHHSNIVPWQIIAEKTGAKLLVVKIHKNGELDLAHYKKLLNKNTKMVAVTHASNTLGTINQIKEIVDLAHKYNAPVLVDGAQAPAHFKVDIQDLNCDFYTFSAHKMYGPTGVGVLYGKEEILNTMPPYQSGGDMIERVTFEKTSYANLPQKFEAGTQNIADAIAFGAAIDFINSIDIDNIEKHEKELLEYATDKLSQINGLEIIGTAPKKTAIISFALKGAHPHDIATILDSEGIAVRAGHHCTMPLMNFYKLPSTTRVSFGIYNTKRETDILCEAILKVQKIFC